MSHQGPEIKAMGGAARGAGGSQSCLNIIDVVCVKGEIIGFVVSYLPLL